MHVVYYPSNIDCFRKGDIVSWAKKNKLDYVIEIHRNAGGGVGVETLVYRGMSDKFDRAVHSAMFSQGYKNRGIKGRTDLANMNRMAIGGISYSLIEVGFIDSTGDNTIFDKTLTNLNKTIFVNLKNSGVKRLGVVYGHGQGDPGAVKGSRKEEKDVRRIKLIGSNVPSKPTPPSSNKPIHKCEFIGANGEIYTFNMYSWDKLLMTLNDGKYNRVVEVITKGRVIYKNGKAVGKYTSNRKVAVRFV